MFHSPHGITAAEGSFFRIFDSIRILSSKDDESNLRTCTVYCIVQSIAIKATISVKVQTKDASSVQLYRRTNCHLFTFWFYWMQLLAITIFTVFYIIINYGCNCIIVISENIVICKIKIIICLKRKKLSLKIINIKSVFWFC